jgi:competence protein ComFC
MSILNNAVKDWLNAGLGLIYPEICQLCGTARAAPAQGYVCGDCRAKVRVIEPPFCERCGRPFEGDITTAFECSNCREMEWHFKSARSAVVARGVVLEAIKAYKHV